MKVQREITTLCLLVVLSGAAPEVFAQRAAISGAEVTGTFRSYFKGKYRKSYNEILIQALGGNKLKIEMELIDPYEVNGELMAHFGFASGEAIITGDTAVFMPTTETEAAERCKVTLKFTKPGTLIVTTEHNGNCGFGFNVEADGSYIKTSSAKPKFGTNEK